MTLPTDPSVPSPGPSLRKVEGALGRRIGMGMAWTLIAAIVTKGGTTAAQIVLGFLLFKEEFGVFAFAQSFASLAFIFRSAGVEWLLVQKGPARFAGLAGPGFWLTLIMNCLGAIVVTAVGVAFAIQRNNIDLAIIPAVLSFGVVISTGTALFRTRLKVDLRFRELANMYMISAIIRSAGMIVLAFMGFGALSLALPTLLSHAAEFIYGRIITGQRTIGLPMRLRLWRPIIARSKWIVVQACATILLTQGNFLVLDFLVPEAVLGIYFFAFQLVLQIHVLLGVNLEGVLMPALSRLAHAPERYRNAVNRSIRVLQLFGTAAAVGFMVGFGPLEGFIWGGKWLPALGAVYVMCMFFPIRLPLGVVTSAMTAVGRYRALGLTTFVSSVGLLGAAFLAGTIFETPEGFALVIGGYFATGVLVGMLWNFHLVGLSPLRALGAILPIWAWGLAVATPIMLAQPWMISQVERLMLAGVPEKLAHLTHFTVVSAGTGLVLAVSARLLLRQSVEEALGVVPGRLSGPVRRVLMLPAPQNATPPAM